MNITYPQNIRLTLPKTDRSLLDPRGVYTLILQNNYTKELFVHKVRDGLANRVMPNPLRYEFEFPPREGLTAGEYTCFLCSYDAWSEYTLDSHIVEQSYINEHDVVMFGGVGISWDGYMLVDRKARLLAIDGEAVVIEGQILAGEISTPQDPYGDLYRKVKIICSEIIKINTDQIEINEYETGCQNYIQP